jgi:hypothetical protein
MEERRGRRMTMSTHDSPLDGNLPSPAGRLADGAMPFTIVW